MAGATEEAITLETGSADRLVNMRAFARILPRACRPGR
jgi:hypothetical protein